SIPTNLISDRAWKYTRRCHPRNPPAPVTAMVVIRGGSSCFEAWSATMLQSCRSEGLLNLRYCPQECLDLFGREPRCIVGGVIVHFGFVHIAFREVLTVVEIP